MGRLAVISTPIGNLGDLSPRAREELATAELVAAEDTRRTGQLLTTLGFARPLISLHEHNESERIGELLEKLRGGARIALVSDAGTPLLSDPGFELVRRVSQEGILGGGRPGAVGHHGGTQHRRPAYRKIHVRGFPAGAGSRNAARASPS